MVLSSKGRFSAIEIKPSETAHQAIGSLMRLANAQGHDFASLELYDTFTINKTGFVRIRSDLDVGRLREVLLQDGRAVILPRVGEIRYEVAMPGGVSGNYSAAAMHATPRVTEFKTYRGTRDKFWERQFSPDFGHNK